MLNTYIKNRGITKTIIHNNNHNEVNELNWDADYDGKTANISIDTNTNGLPKHVDIKLDNNDLANILNIQSINKPIHQRLKYDLYDNTCDNDDLYYIELPTPKLEPREPIIEEPESSIQELIDRRISSPKTGEIFLPLAIDNTRKYTLTPRRRHRRHKTHITHKVYKRSKSRSSSRSSRRRSSRSKSHRSKSSHRL